MTTGKAAPTRAVIYVRQSKTHDGSISQELQEAACRDFAERNDYEVIATEADIDFSGLDMKKRRGLARALGMFTDRKADVMIVWRWSRLSRKKYDQAYLMNEIELAGGRVESALEPTDPTAAGKFSREVLLAMAVFESEQKSETWKQTHQRRLDKGLPASGTKYFGYIKHHDRYEIHEEMAKHLREAYQMYIEDKPIYSIAKMLNEAGAFEQITVLPADEKKGIPEQRVVEQRARWSAARVRQVLSYDFYRGKIMHEGEELPGSHTALISDATWFAYKDAKKRVAMVPPAEKGNTYWLSRLVKCGHCGGTMSKSETKVGKYLRCRGKVMGTGCPGVRCRQDHVEWAVWVWLLDHLDDLANQLPSDDEAKRAADEAVVTTREAMDAASKSITDLQLMAVRMSWNDSQIRGAMDALEPELALATTDHKEALARQGSFTPMTDVWERLRHGMELRHKLEMRQPIYDDGGNFIATQEILYDKDGEFIGLGELPKPEPIFDKKDPTKVNGYKPFHAKADAAFNDALGAEVRAVIKSVTVSPDFPDKPGRGSKPVRLERYKIEAA